MKKIQFIHPGLWTVFLLLAIQIQGQRIHVRGDRFYCGQNEIWLNGTNTPWHTWNDFGTGSYDHDWWDNHMKILADSGINCMRVWISCNGGGISILPNGTVTGVTRHFFDDLDLFFGLAVKHQIYIFATMLSFDHTKTGNPGCDAFRNCFNDNEKTGTLVDRYVVPFVIRYRENPYLFAVDACNEIEWIHEDSLNGNLGWERLQALAARMAVGIHENSPVLFSVGSAAVKWNSESTRIPTEGNFWGDKSLQAQVDHPLAFLDFYSPHWYGWVARWFGNPCDLSPEEYGIGDKPCVIGECPARGMFVQNGSGVDELIYNPETMIEKVSGRGWRGIFPWTSNGVDPVGSLLDFGSASRHFSNLHSDLIRTSAEGCDSFHNGSHPDKPSEAVY
jgi:hypothetical protein